LQRFFPGRRDANAEPQRGRQRRSAHPASPRRRIRILFFSTWGSDYRQLDLSVKALGGMLLGCIFTISTLAVLTNYGIAHWVQAYRLASLTGDNQILRSRLNQTETRVKNLARRANGEEETAAFGLTERRESSELPALLRSPEEKSADAEKKLEANRRAAPVSGKRGPLGLAWTGRDSFNAEKEPAFYGQGGGAYIDDEDNIYPTFSEKKRVMDLAAAETAHAAEAPAGAGNDMISQLEKNLSRTQKLQQIINEKFEIRRKQLEHIPSIKPLLSGRITDLFGKRLDPFVSRVRHHQGLDIGSRRGTEVFSPANGVIEFVKTTYRRGTGYGKAVVIDHGYGVKTLYGHLSQIKVKSGQKVERWDIIGLVGETGRATGPHLHYEVWVDGAACDPMRFILNN